MGQGPPGPEAFDLCQCARQSRARCRSPRHIHSTHDPARVTERDTHADSTVVYESASHAPSLSLKGWWSFFFSLFLPAPSPISDHDFFFQWLFTPPHRLPHRPPQVIGAELARRPYDDFFFLLPYTGSWHRRFFCLWRGRSSARS